MNGSWSLSSLAARDGRLRGIAFIFAFLGLAGAAVLWTVFHLLAVDDVWVRIVFLPPVLVLSGLALHLLFDRNLRALRERLATLRRLADHGVTVEAPLTIQDWKIDSEGDRFWTATYAYSYRGRGASLIRSAGWSGIKTRHPEALRLLVDPERPADAVVLGAIASGPARIVGLLGTVSSALVILWLAGWAFLFFGGIRDQSGLGPLVIAGMVIGIPVALALLGIATRVASRGR
jgi:hypothetical protein